jgi:hypothetical protein
MMPVKSLGNKIKRLNQSVRMGRTIVTEANQNYRKITTRKRMRMIYMTKLRSLVLTKIFPKILSKVQSPYRKK